MNTPVVEVSNRPKKVTSFPIISYTDLVEDGKKMTYEGRPFTGFVRDEYDHPKDYYSLHQTSYGEGKRHGFSIRVDKVGPSDVEFYDTGRLVSQWRRNPTKSYRDIDFGFLCDLSLLGLLDQLLEYELSLEKEVYEEVDLWDDE